MWNLLHRKEATLISKTKQPHPTPCHLLITILEPAEACEQCLWGQVNRKSGQETTGGAKPEGFTCVIASHTVRGWSGCTAACSTCIRWWEIPISFMLGFGGRKMEGEWWQPLLPQEFPLGRWSGLSPQTFPSEAQLAVRQGGETRISIFSQQAICICAHKGMDGGCSNLTVCCWFMQPASVSQRHKIIKWICVSMAEWGRKGKPFIHEGDENSAVSLRTSVSGSVKVAGFS